MFNAGWYANRQPFFLLHPYAEDAAPGTYDAIVVDSSDPVGPASVGRCKLDLTIVTLDRWLERRLLSNG